MVINMRKQTLVETRPTIKTFHRAIDAVIKKGLTLSGPAGRRTDGFIYVQEGHAHYDFGDYCLDVKVGDVIYIAIKDVYSVDVKIDNYRVFIVNFDFYLPEDIILHSAICPPLSGKNIEKLFRKILSTWQMQSATVREECLSILYSIYAEFINTINVTGSTYITSIKRRRMNDALRYINEHIKTETLSIPEIAAAFHLSESHFRRSFKEAFNQSPIQYINMQRISQAKERIRYSNESFSDISEMFGFSSVYHFYHTFKREVGCSPSEYRKRHSQYPQT